LLEAWNLDHNVSGRESFFIFVVLKLVKKSIEDLKLGLIYAKGLDCSDDMLTVIELIYWNLLLSLYHVGYVVIVNLLMDVALHESTTIIFLDVTLPSFRRHLDCLGKALLLEVSLEFYDKGKVYRLHSCRRM
jgi:DNA-binding transcriptional ArsR family regulator